VTLYPIFLSSGNEQGAPPRSDVEQPVAGTEL
jgi:hypothetical protein